MPIAFFLLSLLVATFSSANFAWGSPLNIGLLQTQENQDAALTLRDVPRNMSIPTAIININWTPANIRGRLRFASGYNGDTPENYRNILEDPIESTPGHLQFEASQLPVGYLYCIIDAGNNGYSVVFNIIRVAESAPTMVAPITGNGRQGINTITPTFRWEAINGVPFYHIVVSDQPFDIIEDDQGTRVEGANIIWQGITSETSIQFGIPDPSEFFDNDQTPPLIGSMDRQDRPRYAWVVLNNYGNHPAYTSAVTGGVSGFEVETEPPFEEPENVAPQTRSTFNSEEIIFRWTEVEEAVSYFLYVTREEVSEGGSRALVPAWNAQTTLTSIACPAQDILPNGRFVWKVLAASRQGHGTISDTTSFTYEVRSGQIQMTTITTEGNVLESVEVQVESVDGPSVLSFATDDNGHSLRRISLGTYIFRGIKAGYNDTTSAEITINEQRQQSITLRMRPIPSSIVGTVEDENGDPVSGAIVTATHAQSGEETAAETNVSGAYQCVVAQGSYLINASAAGRQPSEERSIDVPRGVTVDLNADEGPIILEGYHFNISGYVRNSNGQPINSATIIAISPAGDERRLYTPEAGNFSIVAGQGTWRINAIKPGFYLESGEVDVEVNDRDVEVNFTLLPQAGIFSGQVTIDGTPANRNAEVWLIPSAGQITTAGVSQVGAFSRGVSPGDYTAVAVRDGYHTTDSLRLSIDPGETISGLRLALEANASSISGRIVDGSGNALRGAAVEAAGVTTTSDANGNYSLRISAGSHTIVATKADYVTSQRGPITVQAGQDLRDINIRLVDNAGTISGRVRRGNDPIFEAIITATRQGGDGSVATTRSGRDGTYSFGLSFGTYRLTIQKDGFTAVAPGFIDVQLQAGQNVNGRDFPMLSYSGRIVGTITSPAGVVNSPSIRITQLNDPNRNYSTNGNIQGNYALSIAPERRYIVSTTKAGFSTATDTTANLEIEGEIVVNQRLTPLPASFSGTVTIANEPLAGATIRADGQAGSYQSTSDRQGRYTISLQPGQYRATTSKPGYTAVERNVQVNAGDELGGIDFAPEANFALIAGVIRDPNGGAISGATVTVVDSTNQRSITTQSNNDGAYLLEGIIPGNYHLIATSDRFRSRSSNLGNVLGRQERRGTNLVLTPLAARIQGVVTSGGNPIASATIYATEAGGEQFTTVSNNNGQFLLNNISDGRFSLLAAKVGFTGIVRPNIDVDPADTVTTDLELILNNGQITGVVRDPDGAGIRNARVSAIDSLGNFASSNTNAAGQYSLDNLYPRTRYLVSSILSGYSAEVDTIRNVAAGAQANFRLIPNELRITGRTVNQIAQAIGATDLMATSESDGSVFRTTSGDNGDFEFTGLAANNRYRIQTHRGEDYYANDDTTVQTGVNHLNIGSRIVIIERRASVRGRITSNNVGVSDVSITSRNLITGRQRNAYTGGDGSYRILGMRGGESNNYLIRATKPGFVVRQPDSLRVDALGITEERVNVNFTVDEVLVDISGRVIDSIGVAMADVPVTIWSETGRMVDTTDEGGSFAFVDLFPDQQYTLSTDLSRTGYTNPSVSIAARQEDISNIVLTVGRHNAVIAGQIFNNLGVGIPAVTISLDHSIEMLALGGGFYRFESVSPGIHTVTFSRTGYVTREIEVNARNGEGEYIRDVNLDALDNAIFGTVASRADRNFLEGVVIRLISDTADTLYDTTNSGGAYQFNQLDPIKTYSIRSTRKGFESFTRSGLNISTGNAEVNFLISPPSQGIYGKLLSADGEPVAGAEIKIRSFTNQLFRDVTDYFGDYVAPVGAGTYSLIGYAVPPLTGTSRTVNIVVENGASKMQDLRLGATARVIGRLMLEDGTPPLSLGRVAASNDVTGDFYFDVAGGDGSFELAGMRPGEYILVVEAAGYATEINPFTFEAKLDETLTLTVTMTQSGKAITGYVRNQAGEGVSRARVNLTGVSPGLFETDGEGYWTKLAPLAGNYTISIIRNGYQQPADTTFELPAGGIVEINRTIVPTAMAISGRLLGDNGAPYENGAIYILANNQLLDSAFTDEFGEYLFTSLTAQRYELRARATGFTGNPANRFVDLVANGFALDQDFNLSAVRGFGTVRGTVRHGGQTVQCQISIVDLQNGSRFTVSSDPNGLYSIADIPTPSNFRLSATFPDVPDHSSEVFLLQTGENQIHDLRFPTGQIRIQLLNAESNPVVGRRVFISGINVNFTAVVFSDGAGYAETVNWLPLATYSVTPEALVGMLPPSPEMVELAADEIRQLTWFLGWRLTPPPPFSFEDSARVQILVPGAVTVAEAALYFRGPGTATFNSVPLQIDFGGRSPERGLRSVASATPARDGSDETVTYFAYIPPQGRSGTLTYYLQVSTEDGYLFGGIETAQNVTVSARGLLDRVEVTRSQAALRPRPGVALRLSATGFDDGNNDLSARLEDDGDFEWSQIGETHGRLVVDASDASKAIYIPESVGPVEIRSRVSQPSTGVIIAQSISWQNVESAVSRMQVSSPVFEVSAGDSIRFSVTATDTAGILVPLAPIWTTTPVEIATAVQTPFNTEAWLKTTIGIIGKVQVTATDTISDVTATFNDDSPDRSQHGLSVYGELRSDVIDTSIFHDGRGFRIEIPPGSLAPNTSARVYLNEPLLTPVFRLTPNYELTAVGYNVGIDGNLNRDGNYTMVFPVPNGFRLKTPTVGIWNAKTVEWDVIEGEFSTDSTEVIIEVGTLDGLYALISASEALGVRDLKFLPNPFSPQSTRPGLSIEFRLTSDMADRPILSVMIYNMQGQMVRKLVDSQLMPKGDYRRGGENEMIWDGRTDDNREARNGRYIVVLIAKDASGESKVVGSAALIK